MPVIPGGPPLELTVEITGTDGTQRRWGAGRGAGDTPRGLSFRTKQAEGFADGNLTLARRIDREYVDLELLSSVVISGADGSIAYEGRVADLPRSMQDTHEVTVQTAGWMAHARDRKFREVYFDRDPSSWQEPSLARRATMATDLSTGRIQASVSSDGLSFDPPNEALGPTEVAELHYDAGPGLKVTQFYYTGQRPGTWTNFEAPTLWSNDHRDFSATSDSDALTLDDTGRVVSLATPRRYIMLRALTTASVSPPSGTRQLFSAVAIRGNTDDVPIQPAAGILDGVYASDVIRDVTNRFCPALNTAGVQDTSYPIPHLVFRDGVDPYDAFLEVNKYHLWQLGVYEHRTLSFGPIDMTDYDWEVRLSDPGVKVDLQGDSASTLANGIVVTYQDIATGTANVLTPDDHSDLRDPDVNNPATLAGLNVWTELQLSSPSTEDAALQIGRAALAEYNQPKAPGTISVTGHIRDRAGHWQQCWKVRNGDRIALIDHPNDRPRLVVETSYQHDPTPTVSIAVDSTFKRLDAALDRVATSLSAAGLS
jgi:hypothetical protein